jgi:hypothetical protein
MSTTPYTRKSTLICTGASLFLLASAASLSAQEVPEDLVDDEHIREEFGINHFTTPSIRKLFSDLDDLGTLPYDKLKRDIPTTFPRDRALIAMGLGTLIADGFLVVQAEKISAFEDIGRAVLKQSKILGAGMKVTQHTKSILENSGLGEWTKLKDELAKTQSDVEAEMVLLRDVDIAHLVSLGGWIRALEIVAGTVNEQYSAKKAAKLQRVDTVRYFVESLNGLEPKLQENPSIEQLNIGLSEILEIVEKYEDKELDEESVQRILDKVRKLRMLIETGVTKE